MDYSVRTLSPQETRVVLALAEQKRREVGRPEIIKLLGVSAKAADNVIESLRRKGWLERASWGKYLVIPPDEGPDALGENNLLALASRIADPYYIGYGSAATHYGLTTQHRHIIFVVTPVRVRQRQVGEGRVRVVNPKPGKFFGFGPGGGDSEIKLQISRRERPTLEPELKPQREQSYFGLLPFTPAEVNCLALPEILAKKIRACYQRNKARDIYDLGIYATRPLDQPLMRRLVVLKLWQARDTFDPARLMRKFEEGRDFDWDDLRDLVRRSEAIDRERIFADCVRGFGFLAELPPEERTLANDPHQREQALRDRLARFC